MASSAPLLLLLFVSIAAAAAAAAPAPIGLDFHHRFSDPVRRWAEAHGHPGGLWPEKGSPQYYAALVHHDRALHRRRALAASPSSELTFVDGNSTVQISSLGYLHYAVVALGTPNATFLVALDTGSDLFWVPCNCVQCASTTLGNVQLNIYSPEQSSTSKEVSCNSSLCESRACSIPNDSCVYSVQYLSDSTSSSGVLVEDVLYLTTETARPKVVQAPIVFGCGQVQTGSFLDGAAPNGLFGLGMDNVSVPSILASKGIASNSFSMCFGSDGVGRINFGDKGSSDQAETPFNIDKQQPSYNISISGIKVGNSSIHVEFTAIVDSGTSFTILTDPMYTQVTSKFNAQVQESRYKADSSLPFDYCYSLRSGETSINLPDINLTTQSGSVFPVNDPIILVSNGKTPYAYCLALVKSSSVNIIGQNFMTGLRVVFDRERLILGWKNFNCYSVEDSSTLPISPTAPAASPTSAFAPSSYTPEATKQKNSTQVTVSGSPPASSAPFGAVINIVLLLIPLLTAIL